MVVAISCCGGFQSGCNDRPGKTGAEEKDKYREKMRLKWLFSPQCSGLQEVKIPRRIQFHPVHPLGVHHQIVEIPKIDVGEVVRQDSLNLSIILLSSILIELCLGPLDKRIH